MAVDLQKGSVWKRFAAWLLDMILISVLATGVAFVLSAALGYDSYGETFDAAYERYETEYGVKFDMPSEEFDKLTDAEKENFSNATSALLADEEAMQAYEMMTSMTLLIATFSILIAYLALEFAVPMILGNGQTVGKKVFSLAVVRTDCVKLSTLQLFVRSILGKYTVETMIPVYIFIMVFWGVIGSGGTFFLLIFFLSEMLILAISKNNYLLHDIFAVTAVVDLPSQMIFGTESELIEYTKKIHKDRVNDPKNSTDWKEIE